MHTVSTLKKYLVSELKGIYPKEEINAFFRWIMEDKFQISSKDIILGEKRFLESQVVEFKDVVKQLKEEKPLQYILETAHFYGLKFKVNSSVLIPRPETEELINWILKENTNNFHKVIDIGTGSGCIAVALKYHRNRWDITGLDVSQSALNIARENAVQHHTPVRFIRKNVLEEHIHLSDYDIIVSNPPYVSCEEKQQMKNNVLRYEPHLALFSGENPDIFYQTIIKSVQNQLKKNVKIYFEINQYRKENLELWLKSQGISRYEFKKDLNQNWRMLKIILSV